MKQASEAANNSLRPSPVASPTPALPVHHRQQFYYTSFGVRPLVQAMGFTLALFNPRFCGYNGFMGYAWDPDKAAKNIQRHSISFEEAQGVFDDPLAITFEDVEHSETEVREFIIGHTDRNRLLLICFTERQDGIRLISARPVTRLERQDYENQ